MITLNKITSAFEKYFYEPVLGVSNKLVTPLMVFLISIFAVIVLYLSYYALTSHHVDGRQNTINPTPAPSVGQHNHSIQKFVTNANIFFAKYEATFFKMNEDEIRQLILQENLGVMSFFYKTNNQIVIGMESINNGIYHSSKNVKVMINRSEQKQAGEGSQYVISFYSKIYTEAQNHIIANRN